jgi:hypothetical protein
MNNTDKIADDIIGLRFWYLSSVVALIDKPVILKVNLLG